MKPNCLFTGLAFLLALTLVVGVLPGCDEEKPVDENLPSQDDVGGPPPADASTPAGLTMDMSAGDGCCPVTGKSAPAAAAKTEDGCSGCPAGEAMVPAADATTGDACGDACSGAQKKAGCGDDGCGDACGEEVKKGCDDCSGCESKKKTSQ